MEFRAEAWRRRRARWCSWQKVVGYQGLGFRVQGLGFKGLEFRVQGSGFRVQGLGFKGLEFRVQGSGFRVQGLGFKGLEFRVQGLGFKGYHKGSDKGLLRIDCDVGVRRFAGRLYIFYWM